MRIEGENGFQKDGQTNYYVYGQLASGGVEVRTEYYEYYTYKHVREGKGIEEPYFLFGTTSGGKDIFSCLSNGARFSFLFALGVAVVNLIVGARRGAITRINQQNHKQYDCEHVGHLLRCQSAFLAVDRFVVRFLGSGTGSEIGFIISNA
jgi:ABC-type antimicrobial peptide transport system permease subunit